MWAAAVLLMVCADTRPHLVAQALPRKALGGETDAIRRLQTANRAVKEAARVAEKAKKRLREARRYAREANDDLEEIREKALSKVREDARHHEGAWRRELRRGRMATLVMLICFTFMNGVARRMLSSAAPSMVDNGLLTVARADQIFMVGFEAFAIGKLLVVPTTLLLGTRRSVLVQLGMMTLCCGSYLVAPANPAVQMGAWVVFRVFSAMAVSTMLVRATKNTRRACAPVPGAHHPS